MNHEPRARYCVATGVPVADLRDDLTCPACDEMVRLMMLDPDVEVLAPPAHLTDGYTTTAPICEACARHVHPHDAVTVIRGNGWVDTYCGDCAPIEEDDE